MWQSSDSGRNFYIATHYIDGAHVSTVEYLVDMEIESVVDVV